MTKSTNQVRRIKRRGQRRPSCARGVDLVHRPLLRTTPALFHSGLVFVPENERHPIALVSGPYDTTAETSYWRLGSGPLRNGRQRRIQAAASDSSWDRLQKCWSPRFPNQFINLALHCTNAVLLLMFIWSIQEEVILAFIWIPLRCAPLRFRHSSSILFAETSFGRQRK